MNIWALLFQMGLIDAPKRHFAKMPPRKAPSHIEHVALNPPQLTKRRARRLRGKAAS